MNKHIKLIKLIVISAALVTFAVVAFRCMQKRQSSSVEIQCNR